MVILKFTDKSLKETFMTMIMQGEDITEILENANS